MEDSQEHLLSCEKISDKLGLSSVSTLTQPQYDDLFSEDNMKQSQLAAILNERIKVREEMLEWKIQNLDRGEPSVFSSAYNFVYVYFSDEIYIYIYILVCVIYYHDQQFCISEDLCDIIF